MSLNRAAYRVAPGLLRSAVRARGGVRPTLPAYVSAIAILIPRHGLATDTSTHGNSNSNGPPPGFDLKEAQKPLSKEQKAAKAQEEIDALKAKTAIPREGPTVHAPTKASEAQSLAELAIEKASSDPGEKAKLAKEEEKRKKLTLWQKVKKEASHYWDGTKLLGSEVRISSKLALKMAAGYELTRRENRQVYHCYSATHRNLANIHSSFNEQCKIWVDLSRFRSSLLFPLPNFSFP